VTSNNSNGLKGISASPFLYQTCISFQEVMVDRLLERGNFDDTKEAIEQRCANFQNQTRPVLKKYEAKLVKVWSVKLISLS
jgi:adenylate kinase family enzyme